MAKVLRAVGMNKCIGCFTCMFTCAGVNQNNHSVAKSAIHVKTTGGMQSKFMSIVCLACTDERACQSVCPSGALSARKGGGVLLNPELCIGCKKCVQACIVSAVHYDEHKNKPIICKHCGVCAKFCPHECLVMTEVPDHV